MAALVTATVLGGAGGDVTQQAARQLDLGPPRVLDLQVEGGAALVIVPPRVNGALVVFLHGVGQDARSIVDDPDNAPVTEALLEAGYTVAAADAAGDAWGSPLSVSAYRALAEEARRRVGTSVLFLLAESMGGLPALELAGEVPVAGIAAWYPVCDLSSVSTVPGLSAQIEAAYGRDLPVALRDLSPAPVSPGVPFLMWASATDEVVPRNLNADVCAEAARDGGAQAEVVSTEGLHGDPSNFDPPRVVAFFDAQR